MISVCFVCLGNTCRSPTAEALFMREVERQGLATQISADSAGTADYHVGERASTRARDTAKRHGVEIIHRSRQFTADDVGKFNYIVVMDLHNKDDLQLLTGNKTIHLLRSFDSQSPAHAAVPDPYHGGQEGFDKVFAICERSCKGLLQHIKDHDL